MALPALNFRTRLGRKRPPYPSRAIFSGRRRVATIDVPISVLSRRSLGEFLSPLSSAKLSRGVMPCAGSEPCAAAQADKTPVSRSRSVSRFGVRIARSEMSGLYRSGILDILQDI